MKVVVVSNIPSPYRLEVYEALASQSGLDLSVVFRRRRETDRSWNLPPVSGFDQVFATNRRTGPGASGSLIEAVAVARHVLALQPDVCIVGGYSAPLTNLIVHLISWSRGCPVLLWHGSHHHSQQRTSPVLQFGRRIALSLPVGVINYSTSAEKLAQSLGARQTWVVGNAHRHVERAPAAGSTGRSTSASSPGARSNSAPLSLLYVGRLLPRKGLGPVVEALERLGGTAELTVAGEGPCRADLVGARYVELAGWLDGGDLAAAYLRADALILPSQFDPWGLVVNEAMEFGLPVLADHRIGSVPDLAMDGVTACVGDLSTVDGVVEIIERFQAMSEAERTAMIQAARLRVAEHRPPRVAERVGDILRGVVGSSSDR